MQNLTLYQLLDGIVILLRYDMRNINYIALI